MHTRHIQNFLMVSAAFFVMGGTARAEGPSALAAVGAHMVKTAPAQQVMRRTQIAAPVAGAAKATKA